MPEHYGVTLGPQLRNPVLGRKHWKEVIIDSFPPEFRSLSTDIWSATNAFQSMHQREFGKRPFKDVYHRIFVELYPRDFQRWTPQDYEYIVDILHDEEYTLLDLRFYVWNLLEEDHSPIITSAVFMRLSNADWNDKNYRVRAKGKSKKTPCTRHTRRQICQDCAKEWEGGLGK